MNSLLLIMYHYLLLLSINIDVWDFHSPKPVNELACASVYMETDSSPKQSSFINV